MLLGQIMKYKTLLFFTGFIQVALVAINTYQIAHKHWIGCAIVGFLISFVWTFNVQKIAFGTLFDKIIYSTGAMVGVLTGLLISVTLYQ